ncbi:glycosyltransferase family 1 protein, partial [Escherichia coli]|nr:glycosyltransferase family 1 protein [Escherichia coli]
LPEVVLDGHSGLLVPPGDAQALAQALLRLSEQAQPRRLWGEAARQHYLAGFTVEHMIARTEAVYRGALEERP